jgi:dolichol kinase
LLSPTNPAAILPNILLGIASLPVEMIPAPFGPDSRNALHWLITCMPLFVSKTYTDPLITYMDISNNPNAATIQSLTPEVLVLLYPLHQALCITLHYLTTTSLLQAELQLLSISLINVLLLSSSSQGIILKALLWGGGVGIFVLCGDVLRWVVTLARVPKWRFRRARNIGKHSKTANATSQFSLFSSLKSLIGVGKGINTLESDEDNRGPVPGRLKPSDLRLDVTMKGKARDPRTGSISAVEPGLNSILTQMNSTPSTNSYSGNVSRRHTLPNISQPIIRSSKRTPSGRRKRSASSGLQSFFSLTERQATVRKWIYAGYVYICVACIILIGIRQYVGKYALGDKEPIGWALGYVFGNLSGFRMAVISANLEHWILLPSWNTNKNASCHLGWVEHLRQSTFGAANTRLILSGYWLVIIIAGLLIVFRLSAIYEVDTRRKVFHFMMVAMLLPATFIDPTFAALALSLILAIFLLLDLFRASQLPPLSKPLASFLTPYVDGRDLRGPVVISHIFLLIGCAIPLWLSLGALDRTGDGCWIGDKCWAGWDLPTRDISMVAGVICVGMGDAAASLIGRRYGRHKWFWPGGKSIEGSAAFATAVGMALGLAKVWLKIGGWASGNLPEDGWFTTTWKAILAASVASLTEAVLTGGNDNVVVPVVLWCCVKGLGI